MITVTLEDVKKEDNYPCLKVASSGIVVLFVKASTGTVVKSPFTSGGQSIGAYSCKWDETGFDLLVSKLVLENS